MDAMPLHEANRLVVTGQVRVEEIVTATVERVLQEADRYRVWEAFNPEVTLSNARTLDAKIQIGHQVGPLAGCLLAVKDVFCTSDFPTRMGSRLWVDRGQFDARVVATSKDRHAVVLGKTKTAEFAVHEPTDTVNPLYPDRAVGTSSSGSAVAVARGYTRVALATQTAGSIARPASYVGVCGLKPTFGLLPRTGILKTCDDFDTVGLISSTPSDALYALKNMMPELINHPISRNRLSPESSTFKHFAVVDTFGEGHLEAWWKDQLQHIAGQLTDAGLQQIEDPIDELLAQEARHAHFDVYCWNLAYYLSEELSTQDNGAASLLAMISHGRELTSDALEHSRQVIRRWRAALDSQLGSSVVLIEPSTLRGAPALGKTSDGDDNNLLWTAAGVPTLSVPGLHDPEGRNVNLQFISGRFSDFPLILLAECTKVDLAGIRPG